MFGLILSLIKIRFSFNVSYLKSIRFWSTTNFWKRQKKYNFIWVLFEKEKTISSVNANLRCSKKIRGYNVRWRFTNHLHLFKFSEWNITALIYFWLLLGNNTMVATSVLTRSLIYFYFSFIFLAKTHWLFNIVLKVLKTHKLNMRLLLIRETVKRFDWKYRWGYIIEKMLEYLNERLWI